MQSNSDDTVIEFVIGDNTVSFDQKKQSFGVSINFQGIWQVHQNDPDTSPSDFHAHRKDKAETLDLYTGDLYDPRTGNHTGRLKDKEMKVVYQQLQKRNNPVLNQKLHNTGQFTYLD